MNCEATRKLLNQCQGQVSAMPLSGQDHVRDCDECTEYAESLESARLLQDLPVVPAIEGFTDRVLQQAWQNRETNDQKDRSIQRRAVAIAACLVVATGVALQSLWPGRDSGSSAPTDQIVQLTPQIVREVKLLMVSAMDLPDATITLRMDANVNLAGYEGNRELRWPASLIAGNNQLTLPVQLQGVQGGQFSIAVEAQGASKEMTVAVQATETQRSALLVI